MSPAAELIRAYREDILLFCEIELRVTPDIWQREALLAFANGNYRILRVALSACVGPGKSAVLSWCGLWFLLTQGDTEYHPKGLVVSITGPNLRDNLWAEIRLWLGRSKLLSAFFAMNSERIYAKDHPQTWFLACRTFEKKADREVIGRTLSGLHSKFLLYLIDECGGMPPQILSSAEQGMSTADIKFGRILAAGNPTDHSGALYHIVKRDLEKWKVVYISGDPEDPKRSPRISMEWAKEQIRIYGRDDAWVQAHVLGVFPSSSINTLLSHDEVVQAQRRHYRPEQYDFAEKRIGVDVAGGGMDLNVLFPRQGLVAFNYVSQRQCPPDQLAARIIASKVKWNCNHVFVDASGGMGQ